MPFPTCALPTAPLLLLIFPLLPDLIALSDEDLTTELGCKPLQARRRRFCCRCRGLCASLPLNASPTPRLGSRSLRHTARLIETSCFPQHHAQARKIRQALIKMGFQPPGAEGEAAKAAAAPAAAAAAAPPPAGYPAAGAAPYPPPPGAPVPYGAPPPYPYPPRELPLLPVLPGCPVLAMPLLCLVHLSFGIAALRCSSSLLTQRPCRRQSLPRTTPARKWRRRCCSPAPTGEDRAPERFGCCWGFVCCERGGGAPSVASQPETRPFHCCPAIPHHRMMRRGFMMGQM